MSTRIRYGCPGHLREYMIHDDRYNSDNFFPDNVESELMALLPEGWSVMNRGSRIEVLPTQEDRYRDSTYPVLLQAVETVIGDVKQFTIFCEDAIFDILADNC